MRFGFGRRPVDVRHEDRTSGNPAAPRIDSVGFLAVSRDKWREVPGGDTLGRVYSTDLLGASDEMLRSQWQVMDRAGSDPTHRGWYKALYREFMAGRHVVEVGSGLGFDGISFMQCGARWVFSDIVKDNLTIVRRMVDLLGLSDQADYLWIEGPESLEKLPAAVDVIWANGSLHHAPFEIARKEAQHLLRKLTPGGRWIELFYPYERWLRQGKMPFSEWGKYTDGERTPWAEWHDAERIKQRLFPAVTTTILDYRFGGGQYGWLDLRVDQPVMKGLSPADIESRTKSTDILNGEIKNLNGSLKRRSNGLFFSCTDKMWSYAATIDLKAAELLRTTPVREGFVWAVDLEVSLESGAAGFVLTGDDFNDFVGREVMLDARPAAQRLTIATDGPSPPRYLLIRNGAHQSVSTGTLISATIRSGT